METPEIIELDQTSTLPYTLSEYISECIEAEDGYLMGILITSGVQAKEESMGIDFGAGKSTLLGNMLKNTCLKYDYKIPDDIIPNEKWNKLNLGKYQHLRAWEKSKLFWSYFPWELSYILDLPFRIPMVGYDDVNVTMGKSKSNSKPVRDFVDDLKNERTHLGVLVGTASHIMDIAHPWRSFFKFEVIVPYRGAFEVQFNKRYKNFYDPEKDIQKMDYRGTGSFPKFPTHFKRWYDDWRESKRKRNKLSSLLKLLKVYRSDYDVEDLIAQTEEKIGLLENKNTEQTDFPIPGKYTPLTERQQQCLDLIFEKGRRTDYQLEKDGLLTEAHQLKMKGLLMKTGRGSHMFIPTEKAEKYRSKKKNRHPSPNTPHKRNT